MSLYSNSKITLFSLLIILNSCNTNEIRKEFSVIAFYSGENDLAHISFIDEAHRWFTKIGEIQNFSYDSTNDWKNLNIDFLSTYDIVLFLDIRPEDPSQREAFEKYMNNGGAWIGFHFAGFSLQNSAYDTDWDWDWYHNEFLGSGEYKGNTWRPTSAVLKVENQDHPITKNLPSTFNSAPNEWYSWHNDLTENPDIDILVSIDPSSFPLGTGPKEWEIWTEGYYPVIWTNNNYRMLYVNMGHNDMDYDGGTNLPLSSTFNSNEQNTLLINALNWLGQ
tara:strand:+ start:24476 stop:25306 length:831 start_codon:yes stop_codon:yes gene_type:complete